ncbi:MAG: ATP-binding cassette domain-containing protein [Bacillota bacterium]|nr:ATP-binding cassette domain-containing protein [Bacillota bacterium]
MNDIVIQNLCKSFGEKKVLNNFNYVFKAGHSSCIMGESGCGKTTLLNIILGLEKLSEGTISGVPDKKSAVFQEDRLSEDFTAYSNVHMVCNKNVSEGGIKLCLSELGLKDSIYTPVRELSGGMKRRVTIARALMADYDLIIMDEPFKGLDEATKSLVIKYINKKTEGKTFIAVTHDEYEAKALHAEVIKMGIEHKTNNPQG